MRFIGSVSGPDATIGSAMCALCDAAANGIDVPEEVYNQLTQMAKLPDGIVTARLNISPPVAPDPMIGMESKIGYVDYYVRVVKSKLYNVIEALKAPVDVPESKKVAKEKKRKRVFSQEDLESSVPKEDDSR